MTTLTHADAFLRDICADPADNSVRLIYADWLEDEGGDPARAEFIRVQVESEANPICQALRAEKQGIWQLDAHAHAAGLLRRERELLTFENVERWAAYSGWGVGVPVEDTRTGKRHHGCWLRGGTYLASFDFRRGFVGSVTLTLADWWGTPCPNGGEAAHYHNAHGCHVCSGTGHLPGHGRELVKVAPLTRVVLSDREPLRLSSAEWTRLTGDWSDRAEEFQSASLPAAFFGRKEQDRSCFPRPSRESCLEWLSERCLQLARG